MRRGAFASLYFLGRTEVLLRGHCRKEHAPSLRGALLGDRGKQLQVTGRLLCFACGSEDCSTVAPQHFEPTRQVGGIVGTLSIQNTRIDL
jgi:hypothetical protein